ncbi:EAL domain-containing protein [Roseospira marina]|uniref:Sensor protein FixL n=1 Tax=Roseospira marina TaxID=140057 RepID=A0A5M6IB15_9PROT|nr:EAL domain-containing protein [Roseospira marina]KAA5604919.1 EAL domain-containing protein [Roseospira marina]MBB4315261.1 diguanylate cyclase (GGDEF)-like protein/PAS domain S-box-containing protein [Roseospira marina]MBB5088261.1 diguanylate cyclase (GGDEF)-like protein/PAS domain S-box-containing protein [Roseospira marina]
MRVLLVEDNPSFASLVSALLDEGASAQFDVIEASTLEAALDALSRDPFDVVVLDLQLPDSVGLATLDPILRDAPDTPIIVLTGTDDAFAAVAAVRRGAQDYLSKDGLSAESLLRAIHYACARKETLTTLAKGGAFLEGVVNTIGDGLAALECVRDPNGAVTDFRCLLVNPAFTALFQRTGSDVTDAGLRALADDVGWPGLVDVLARVVADREPRMLEQRIQRPDGDTGWVRLGATALADGVAITLTDITESQVQKQRVAKALEQAEAADAAKTTLMQAISHELRTPLNSIIGFAEVIQAEVFGPMENAQYRTYIDDIVRSGNGMLEIINDLLDLRRLKDIAHADRTYRHLIDLAPDLICVVRDNRIEVMNDAGAAILGVWPADSLIGRDFRQYVHEDSRPLLDEAETLLVGEHRRLPAQLLDVRGRVIDVELAAVPYDPDGPGIGYMLVARDVSERQRATEQIIQREERLSKIMDTMVDALIIVDSQGTIETFNAAAETMFEYEASEAIGKPVTILMPEEAGAKHQDHIVHYLTTGKSRVIGMGREVEARRQDGTTFPAELALSEMKIGGRHLFIGMMRDITERKIAEQRLLFLATRNPLTGLPNRALFRDRLEAAISRADTRGTMLGILFVDLDHFKNINDTLGHPAGDRVLQMAGRRLQGHVRPGDTVSHQSGDEFTVILEHVSGEDEVADIAHRMLIDLSRPFEVDGREIYTSGSIGVVIYPRTRGGISNLLRNVDTAVNFAKKKGRNNYQFYTDRLSDDMVRRLQIETGLRRALERDELFMVYQPKVDLTSRAVVGAEALLRWRSTELGDVSPVEFVPVAEETGLVVPIGEWVLRAVCKQLRVWRDQGLPPIRVGVNLSARQFRDQRLAETIKGILSDTGVKPELLDLELTESMLVENADEAVEALWSLKNIGITLSIDDFGTGYSSLSYLKRFPIDALKIDRSFVMDIPSSEDDMAITQAIIRMASSLGLQLIAEGVETEPQVEFLRANGCQLGQGYLFSKPIEKEGMADLLKHGWSPQRAAAIVGSR